MDCSYGKVGLEAAYLVRKVPVPTHAHTYFSSFNKIKSKFTLLFHGRKPDM